MLIRFRLFLIGDNKAQPRCLVACWTSYILKSIKQPLQSLHNLDGAGRIDWTLKRIRRIRHFVISPVMEE